MATLETKLPCHINGNVWFFCTEWSTSTGLIIFFRVARFTPFLTDDLHSICLFLHIKNLPASPIKTVGTVSSVSWFFYRACYVTAEFSSAAIFVDLSDNMSSTWLAYLSSRATVLRPFSAFGKIKVYLSFVSSSSDFLNLNQPELFYTLFSLSGVRADPMNYFPCCCFISGIILFK